MPQAHARRTDPETSHIAASTVDEISAVQAEILRIYRLHGDMIDEQLEQRYLESVGAGRAPSATEQSIRSRRSELVKDFGLVEFKERKERRRKTNGLSRVWGLAEEAPEPEEEPLTFDIPDPPPKPKRPSHFDPE